MPGRLRCRSSREGTNNIGEAREPAFKVREGTIVTRANDQRIALGAGATGSYDRFVMPNFVERQH